MHVLCVYMVVRCGHTYISRYETTRTYVFSFATQVLTSFFVFWFFFLTHVQDQILKLHYSQKECVGYNTWSYSVSVPNTFPWLHQCSQCNNLCYNHNSEFNSLSFLSIIICMYVCMCVCVSYI